MTGIYSPIEMNLESFPWSTICALLFSESRIAIKFPASYDAARSLQLEILMRIGYAFGWDCGRLKVRVSNKLQVR